MILNHDNISRSPALRRPMAPKNACNISRALQVTETAGALVARVSEENGLDRALAAGQIDVAEHEAGLIRRARVIADISHAYVGSSLCGWY